MKELLLFTGGIFLFLLLLFLILIVVTMIMAAIQTVIEFLKDKE